MTSANALQILVWKGPAASDRIDLASPLDDCGTGVAQVLAILYVVLQGERLSTIVIDEPNSFLHPGAMASLIEILHEHKEHQYIVATHSPGVISASRPVSLHLLQANGYETHVAALSPFEVTTQRLILDKVGARLEDVFGPDRVLWLEGPSEAKVFRLLAREFQLPIARLAFLPLVNVGDLEAKHANLVTQVYQKMVSGIALIPPACAFILDRESRPEPELERIRAAAGGRVLFLKRAMLENYFLDAEALVHLLEYLGETVALQTVQQWISNYLKDQSAPQDALMKADWLRSVHGAHMLGKAVSDLSDTRHRYGKVRDGPVLAKWLSTHKPEALDGLLATLYEALQIEYPGIASMRPRRRVGNIETEQS